MKKILVVATHPDDETLGCGGTILKHKARGDEIYWLICTQLANPSHKRSSEVDKVASSYSFDKVFKLGLITTAVDQYNSAHLINEISKIFLEIEPNVIYLPHKSDIHSDHRIIFNAAFSCTKSFRYPSIEQIYMMETLSETEYSTNLQSDCFSPNVFVDISDFMQKKLEIIKIYSSEIADPPFPRSIKNLEALATFRGSTAGCRFAESFMLLREIK